MRLTWFVAATTLCIATVAHADGKLYTLSGSGLPRDLRTAPAELTRVFARSLEAEPMMPTIEEAAQILECELETKSCLESIARTAKTSKIMFGRVVKTDDGVVVKLTTFELGDAASEKSFSLEGDTVDALADALTQKLDKPRRVPPPPPIQDDPEAPPTKQDPLPPTPTDVDQPVAAGKISKGSWALIIGGGAATLAGGGFLLSANQLRGDLRKLPTDTLADIRRLQSVERAGKLRTQVGGALMLAGGAVMTVGIVRAAIQRREPSTEKPMIDVVPERGGASILFTVGWP